MRPERKSEDEIQAIVSAAVTDAISFIESEIDPDRDKAQRYYNGEVDFAAPKGRSKVIATKCRDVVRQVKPSLMRVFLSTDKPGEFIPRTPADVQGAAQATSYAEYKLAQNNGYTLLTNAFQDALVKKVGILKAYYDEATEIEFDEYTGLTDEEFALVAQDEGAKIVEHTATVEEETGPDGFAVERTTHDAKVSYETEGGDIKIKSVPPEDFFVDSQASDLSDCYIAGHKTDMRVGDLVAMGFDFSEVSNLDVDDGGADDEADFSRRGYVDDDTDSDALDPSMKPVTVYEAYMEMDIEGTGIPRLYSFILGGSKMELLSHEPADFMPFAIFEIDPEPHSFFGNSLVDLIINDQDIMTNLWRSMIDNMQLANNPGMAVDSGNVNKDDVLNNEIGKIVRTKGTPTDKIMPFSVPFTAGATIPALEMYDQLIQDKTGVSRASMGLDPDVMQNTTATAINASVGAAQGQMEAMARNLAEGGLTQLYKILLMLIRQHATEEEMIMVDGQFTPVDPRSWSKNMGVMINVGLGRGGQQERMATLQQTHQTQTQIWGTFGPSNGLVTLTQIRNTLADIQKLGGVHNSDRYYMPMNPGREKQLQQEAAQAARQAAQGQTDPNAINAQAIIQAETIKAQAKSQTDMARVQVDAQKAMASEQRERFKLGMEDDLQRDKMVQDLAVQVAKILGQYGTSVDVASVNAAQNAQRTISPSTPGGQS